MELELKNLAPYLNYSLKGQFKCDLVTGIATMTGIDNYGVKITKIDDWILFKYFKPILRPLSELKEVVSEAMNNINTDVLVAIQISEFANKKISLHNLSYGAYEELLRNHYDVFGLIDAGLAVDINTLSV